MSLLRRFTPLHMLALSINGIIGSAWLFAPLYAAKIAGPGALISWLLGGGATILIAITFAEISTMLPITGGTTRFAELTHGAATGFAMSWISWLSSVTMPPIEVQAVLQYLSTYLPNLSVTHNHITSLSHLGLFWAVVLMLALTLLNIASFKGFIRTNFFIFSFKLLVIMLTIFWLIHSRFHLQNFSSSINGGSLSWPAILSAIATGGIAFSLTGFKHGFELAGEMTRPNLTIPLAIIGSVVTCLLLYIGLQIAFIGALHPAELSGGWANLHFSGDVGPFLGIAAALGLLWLVKLLLIDAFVSPIGAGLIYTTSTARIIYAMSCNHYMSAFFSKLSKDKMPLTAIWFNFFIGILLFLPFPGWQNMVSFLVSAAVIAYAMGPIALVCLRKQMPTQKRAFRLPLSNLLCFFAFYCCNLISFWVGWETLWKLSIALVIGALIFISNPYFRNNKPTIGLKALYWLVPYLIGLMTLSYLGEYGGGHHIIKFGWDFLIIAIFSLIIFSLAIRTRLTNQLVQQQFEYLQANAI